MDKIPLNYEASEGDTHKQVSDSLPPEVVQCLQNARFLHLATCVDNVPHVSLMNYTYLPHTPYSPYPVIVMTSNQSSRKTTSIRANPNVSILVHDWVSHRPLTHSRRASGGSPAPQQSSLAAILFNLNTAAIGSISATIGGTARIAEAGSEEEEYFCKLHIENHSFEEGVQLFRQDNSGNNANGGGGAGGEEAGRRTDFVPGGDVTVIVVKIKDVRISDHNGTVKDWALEPATVNGAR